MVVLSLDDGIDYTFDRSALIETALRSVHSDVFGGLEVPWCADFDENLEYYLTDEVCVFPHLRSMDFVHCYIKDNMIYILTKETQIKDIINSWSR